MLTDQLKVCGRCRRSLPVESFHFHRSGERAGRPICYCKECGKQAQREKPNRKEIQLRSYIKSTYGLSWEDYKALGDSCQICGTTTGRLCVDHDHDTGRIRGLLCSTCNSGLGLFKDSPDLLAKAADYLGMG